MINSFKGARLLKFVRNNDPISQEVWSQAGPKEISLAPSDRELNTGAAGSGSVSCVGSWGREQSLNLFVLKSQEAWAPGGGSGFKTSECIISNSRSC